MLQLRSNRWPPKEFRPEFYTHDLADLAAFAGINVRGLVKDKIFPQWLVVRAWHRGDTYDIVPMRATVAQDILDAACGPDGVIAWLMKRFPRAL
jgi:hypothetical protein